MTATRKKPQQRSVDFKDDDFAFIKKEVERLGKPFTFISIANKCMVLGIEAYKQQLEKSK
jgi:hypothetical protein